MAGQVKLSVKKQNVYVAGGEGYITRAVRYSTIDSDSVLEYAALNSGINRAQIAASVEAVLQTFENFLCNGHSVQLPRIGNFRFGVNASFASTEDEGGADAVTRRKVYFTPSSYLKGLLEDVSLSTEDSDEDEDEDTSTDDTEDEEDTDTDSTDTGSDTDTGSNGSDD